MPQVVAPGRMQHKSMADQVSDMLRRMILTRELAPGQRVRQAELAQMLGVSTMPVREALLRLVSEGMVVADANRSFSVADTTEKGIRDIYWMHSVLAGELAARACAQRDDALVLELEACHAEYGKAVKAGSHERLFSANWRFHAAINKAATSPAIAQQLKNTLRFFPDFSFDVPGWVELAGQWQKGLIKAVRERDGNGARDVSTASVQKAADLFVRSYWTHEEPGTLAKAARSTSKPSRTRRQI
jgi:DNA-binding GntR family transcriptional regulator